MQLTRSAALLALIGLSMFPLAAIADQFNDWQVVNGNPLVQVRWDVSEHPLPALISIQFKSDRDVTLNFVATVEKQSYEGGYLHRVQDRTSGTVYVSRSGAPALASASGLRVLGVTARIQ